MAPHLRILAGPSPNSSVGTELSLEDVTYAVNTKRSIPLRSEYFDGEVAVNIKGLIRDEDDEGEDSKYFERESRKDVTWSLQVRGRFLKPVSADDVLFGNTFDHPLWLPWGSSAVFKFMQYIDPTLEHDLGSRTKPWALSPLISTMPHFEHVQLSDSDLNTQPSASEAPNVGSHTTFNPQLPPFPPTTCIGDDTTQLHKALISQNNSGSSEEESDASSIASGRSSGGKSTSSRSSIKDAIKSKMKKRSRKQNSQQFAFASASERRAHFSDKAHREAINFGPEDVISVDFCYGFLEFSPSLALKLPGGLSFDLMKYWDGQPVRFVCCERKKGDVPDQPWGRIFWTVVIELRDQVEAATA